MARCAGLQTAFNSHHPPQRKKCSSQKTLAFFNNTILNLASVSETKVLRSCSFSSWRCKTLEPQLRKAVSRAFGVCVKSNYLGMVSEACRERKIYPSRGYGGSVTASIHCEPHCDTEQKIHQTHHPNAPAGANTYSTAALPG